MTISEDSIFVNKQAERSRSKRLLILVCDWLQQPITPLLLTAAGGRIDTIYVNHVN